MSSWENTFKIWASPPGETEQKKCQNAEEAIRNAIGASSALRHLAIKVFPQGSYRNRTNARADSDVDICVVCPVPFFYRLTDGITTEEAGIFPASYSYKTFKDHVESALRSHFGSGSVKRGNKAFDIRENSYRVSADVVPCFEHRLYYRPQTGTCNYVDPAGTELRPDSGGTIINWPEHHYNNGVEKNTATGNRFKALVRILKHLRNDMADRGSVEANAVCSYLIECAVWNVPDSLFGGQTLTADVREVLIHLFHNTASLDKCKEWREINGIKWLYINQPWTPEQVSAFAAAAWRELRLE